MGAKRGDHFHRILPGADGLLDIKDEFRIASQHARHFPQECKGTALAALHILLRDGDAEFPPGLIQAHVARTIQHGIHRKALLAAVQDKKLRSEAVHGLEGLFVIVDHVHHPPVIAAEKRHGFDGAGEGMDGREGHAEAFPEGIDRMQVPPVNVRIGIDEQLCAGDAVERKLIDGFLKMLRIQTRGRDACQHDPFLLLLIRSGIPRLLASIIPQITAKINPCRFNRTESDTLNFSCLTFAARYGTINVEQTEPEMQKIMEKPLDK